MKNSPEATAITCFALIVAMLFGGWQTIAMLVGDLGGVLVDSTGALGLLTAASVAGAAILVGFIAHSATRGADGTWVRWLGQSTIALAVVLVAGAGLLALIAFTGGNYRVFG